MKIHKSQKNEQLLSVKTVGGAATGAATIPDHRPATLQRRKLQEAMQDRAVSGRDPAQPNIRSGMSFRSTSDHLTFSASEGVGGLFGDTIGDMVHQSQRCVEPGLPFKGSAGTSEVSGSEYGTCVTGVRSSVFQLTRQRDVEKDCEKLKEVYQMLMDYKMKPAKKTLEKAIYIAFSMEKNRPYLMGKDDLEQLKKGRFEAQRERRHLKKLKGTAKSDREDKKNALIDIVYKEGGYFFIRNPKLQPEHSTERLILNLNRQRVGIDLLNHISYGWQDAENEDWRKHIKSAKCLACSDDITQTKYDKVVIYYLKEHSDKIEKGVMNQVPIENRNENISAFYFRIAKGIGVAKQEEDKSFTTGRSEFLSNWILENWEKVREMGEEDFVSTVNDMIVKDIDRQL